MKTIDYNLRGKGQGASGKGNTRSLAPRPSPLAPAFTLTEILIVIGLIVLLLALALPAFNFITGGRSVDAAQNNIAAFLARARTEAIGLQETRGLMFFIDPKTPDRVSVAIVHETPAKATDNTNIDVFVDLTVDSEFLQLPKNVGVQLVDDCAYSGSPPTRADDGYIGFNDRNALGGTSPNGIRYGGIILFDGNGILTSKAYGFRATEANSSGTQVYTRMGELLFQNAKQGSNANPGDKDVIPTLTAGAILRSQFGLVVFDQQTFDSDSSRTLDDSQITNTTYKNSAEQTEELWLDNNATAMLINRYNGTLVKGD